MSYKAYLNPTRVEGLSVRCQLAAQLTKLVAIRVLTEGLMWAVLFDVNFVVAPSGQHARSFRSLFLSFAPRGLLFSVMFSYTSSETLSRKGQPLVTIAVITLS